MRFLFYDAITSIEKARSIEGVKTFSLSEEFLRSHYTRCAYVPGVLFTEAMAQLLGWLITYSSDFKVSAALILLEGVVVPPHMRPGFRAEIRGEIISSSRRDTMGRGEIRVEGERIAWVDRILYGHFESIAPGELKRMYEYYSGNKIVHED